MRILKSWALIMCVVMLALTTMAASCQLSGGNQPFKVKVEKTLGIADAVGSTAIEAYREALDMGIIPNEAKTPIKNLFVVSQETGKEAQAAFEAYLKAEEAGELNGEKIKLIETTMLLTNHVTNLMDELNPYLGGKEEVKVFQAYLGVAGAALRVFNSFYWAAEAQMPDDEEADEG